MKRILIALFVTALMVATVAATSTDARASITKTWSEKAVLKAVNAERAKRGLVQLRFNDALVKAARYQARDMAAHHRLSHRSSNGWTLGTRLARFGYGRSGYRSWKVGEDLARARAGTTVAKPVWIVSGWMATDSHRKIILTPAFRHAGVGLRSDGTNVYYVLDLGVRRR